MSSTLLPLLDQLDLGGLTAHVYLTLLREGPMSSGSLVRTLQVRLADLKDPILMLLRKRLIAVNRNENRQVFYATDPILAWLAIEAELVWQVSVDLGPVAELRTTGEPTIEAKRAVCSRLGRVAHRLYKPNAASLAQTEHGIQSTLEMSHLVTEAIYQAKRYVMGVSRSPRKMSLAHFWTVLSERMHQGVRYLRVTDLYEVLEHGLAVIKRDLGLGIDLRILESEQIQHRFYLVDGRIVVATDQTGTHRAEVDPGVGWISTRPQVVKRYRKRFAEYAEQAIPGPFVVDQLSADASRLIRESHQVLREDDQEWFESMIWYGKFSTYAETAGWSDDRRRKSEKRALRAGLLMPGPYERLVPAYVPDTPLLREAFAAQAENNRHQAFSEDEDSGVTLW